MSSRSLEVAIAAGGTAGHVNPALALAEELAARGHHVRFFGQEAKLEGRLVPEAGFELVPIKVSGFDRSRPWTAVSSLVSVNNAEHVVKAYFEEHGAPDVAVGFGAYVEVPLLDRCRHLEVPYLLHEQNSVPGLANKMMATHAARVCVSFPAARTTFLDKGCAEETVVITGNPVRKSVTTASRVAGRAAFGVEEDQTMLLIFGGSLGAKHINEALANLKHELLAREDLVIVHSTGADGLDEALAELALTPEEAARWKVVPYISNMGEALAAADLVVSRAGASSVAEIAALAVPAVLVPYPYATADHQTTNAHLLVDAGAAVLVRDDDLDGEAFEAELLGLLDSPDRREAMRESAAGLGQANAAAALADEVERAAER